MAQYSIIYTSDGRIKRELTFKNKTFGYAEIPDETGKTSDNKVFESQIADQFPDMPEEALEAAEKLNFPFDEDEVAECLGILEEYE